MSAPIEYPLEDVRLIKIQRRDKAEELVKQRRKELEEQEKKLEEAKKKRDKVLEHQTDKLNQLRQAFDEGTTSDEIIQMKNYLKVVQEKVEAEEEKVKAQQEEVTKAEEELEMAKEELRARRNEVDKLDMHKTQWVKMMQEELRLEMAKELDEIGNILYLKNREKWK